MKLEGWARFTAMGLGVVLAAIGCWAVLTDSGNQAGTLGIFAAGLVLLVMGLQNTPLTGISAGGGASFSTQEQTRLTTDLAKERLDGGEPDEARAVIETAAALNPRILKNPTVQALNYEANLGLALEAIDPDAVRAMDSQHANVDYAVKLPSGRTIAVESKYTVSRPLNSSDINRVVERAHKGSPEGEPFSGLLLVTNNPVTPRAAHMAAHLLPDFPVEIAHWEGGSDLTSLMRGMHLLDRQPD